MEIAPAVIRCRFRLFWIRAALDHRAAEVAVTQARLMPPGIGLRTGLELFGEDGSHARITIFYGRRRILEALEQAGFMVTHRKVWMPSNAKWPLNTPVRPRRARTQIGSAVGIQEHSPAGSSDTGGTSLSLWWVALAFFSYGFLAWGSFLYASARTGHRPWRRWAIAYGVFAVCAVALVAAGSAARGILGGLCLLPVIGLAFGSPIHILTIRGEFARRVASQRDPNLLLARRRADLLEAARGLAADDPAHARRMGIGRPDVPGAFDAGVIDINHAGASVLATLPGIDAAIAAQIVDLRSEGIGFSSLADLDLALDLPYAQLQELRDKVVFIPRD